MGPPKKKKPRKMQKTPPKVGGVAIVFWLRSLSLLSFCL